MPFINQNVNMGQLASSAYGQGVGIGATAYEKAQAQQIQKAIVDQQLAQKDSEFQDTAARKQTVDDAMIDYRKRMAAIGEKNAETNDFREAANERFKGSEAEDRKAKIDALAKNRETQADWVTKNRPQDLDYFNAFGKLPGHDATGFQTDPQTHALEQGRKDVENEWLKAAKALKDHSAKDMLDESDKVPGAKAGHEAQFTAIKAQADAYAAQHKILTDQLYRRHMQVAGVNVDGDPFGVGGGQAGGQATQPNSQAPQPGGQQNGPVIQPGGKPAPAIQIPKAPGIHGAGLNAPGLQHGQPQPQGAAQQGFDRVTQNQLHQAPVAYPPEQKQQWLGSVAAEKGVKPDAIGSLPAATPQAAAKLWQTLQGKFSDPNKLGAEFIRQMVLAGFDPQKPPVETASSPVQGNGGMYMKP